MKKISGLLALTFSMVLLGGCGDKTSVTTYYDSDFTEESPIEHIAISDEKNEVREGKDENGHIEINQHQECAVTDNENSASREKHVPVVENNYTTVQNDNSTTVKEENTLNYEHIQNSDNDTNQSIEYHENFNNTYSACNNEEEKEAADSQESKRLGTPVLSEWEKTADTAEMENPAGDGVTYTVTWDEIEGADGYEVELKTKGNGSAEEDWFVRTTTVTEPQFSNSFSHIDMHLKVKVRAYREIDTVKEYGDWSSEKETIYSP